MSLSIEIEDGRGGTKKTAMVTPRGQLVTAPLDFSTPFFNQLAVNNQVYNFVEPRANKQFVITGILINASRNVGVNGSVVEIYQADAIDSATATNQVIITDVGRSTSMPMTGLNTIMQPGTWLNAKADDTDVYITILGYFVDKSETI